MHGNHYNENKKQEFKTPTTQEEKLGVAMKNQDSVLTSEISSVPNCFLTKIPSPKGVRTESPRDMRDSDSTSSSASSTFRSYA